jgi:acyl carrier protein
MTTQINLEARVNQIVECQMIASDGIVFEFKPTDHLANDLGFDSLDLIEMVMAIEDEFGIEISDEDADKIGTVQQAVDYVKTRIK